MRILLRQFLKIALLVICGIFTCRDVLQCVSTISKRGIFRSYLYLPLYTFSTLHTAKPPLYPLSLRFIFFINCLKNIDKHNFYIPKRFLTKTH